MRIAIDGTTLCAQDGSVGAGIEHYSWSIIQALLPLGTEHEFFISTPPGLNRVRRQELLETGARVTLLSSWGPKLSFVSRHGILPLRFLLRRPDVLFSPFGQTPLGWRGKSVVTVHDLAIYEHPEWFPPKQSFATRVVVPKSIERASRIIAVSNSTQQKLYERMPATVGRVLVVHEGVDLHEAYAALGGAQASTRFPFDRESVLFLGTIEPRKNLRSAFRAFHAFLQSRPEQASQVRFIVAGKKGWHTREIEEELVAINHAWKNAEPNGVIQLLGPVTEEEKWNLLARASCLLYRSWDEGFGLPLLEAMAVGTPVIASNRGALPEVGGDAAVYVDPEDIEAMSFALIQCLLVPEGVREIRELGIQRAAEFSWERAAQETMKILEEVARSKNET
ncbi:MAG: Glycosyl transferase, group 1 [Candidatus Uhrbacteria bacterium GW2011_GWA2_52_8d]|uniref:Glycosyl transferase, group 1 n=1 Tax=Candidatus Uhrbacteria bacterium GW2011_GWA2_52_8d TaxID=1618979 RepID=A0A0G1XMM4_9BACT|nr:MAG: Glycosyl transferase, group 1 [Candidatus Uhrbacteria bacterium GW2011_GWA2_52_8d]